MSNLRQFPNIFRCYEDIWLLGHAIFELTVAIEYRCENEKKYEIVLACHKGPIGLGKRNSTFLLLYYVARIEYNLFGQLNNKLI